MVLVATSSWAETVPLQPNQTPPWRLSNERTATASPPGYRGSGRLHGWKRRSAAPIPILPAARQPHRGQDQAGHRIGLRKISPQSPGLRIDILRQQAIAIAICQRVDEQLMRLLAA